MQVDIIPENKIPTTVCTSNFKYLYWNMEQQLAHQTINGCNIKAGDVYGSGTISAPDQYGYGSMLELTWRGTKPMRLSDDTERKFINDNDTVIMKGWCEKIFTNRFWRSAGKIITRFIITTKTIYAHSSFRNSGTKTSSIFIRCNITTTNCFCKYNG